MEIPSIKYELRRELRRYNPRIEDDGDQIYLYIYGVDEMSRRHFNNINSGIESVCNIYGLDYEIENGDEWCWTIWEE